MSDAMANHVEHTPGPWDWTAMPGVKEIGICGPQGPLDAIATVHDRASYFNVTLANAVAIAALPELLEVCELALAFHSADTEAFVARYGHGMTTKDLCDRIRAVLAKAEGRGRE